MLDKPTDARLVQAIKDEFAVGLQLFERFQVGDKVAHINCGDGLVVEKTRHAVKVIYERTYRDGTNMVGFYDPLWFDLHPRYLFHCGTIAAEP